MRPKPDKDHTKEEKSQMDTSHEQHKNLQQNVSKLNPAVYKKSDIPEPSRVYSKDAGLVQYKKTNQYYLPY